MRRLRKCLKRMERPIGIEPTPEPWNKVRFSHLRRWNGGTYTKFDNSQLENDGKQQLLKRVRFRGLGS